MGIGDPLDCSSFSGPYLLPGSPSLSGLLLPAFAPSGNSLSPIPGTCFCFLPHSQLKPFTGLRQLGDPKHLPSSSLHSQSPPRVE